MVVVSPFCTYTPVLTDDVNPVLLYIQYEYYMRVTCRWAGAVRRAVKFELGAANERVGLGGWYDAALVPEPQFARNGSTISTTVFNSL